MHNKTILPRGADGPGPGPPSTPPLQLTGSNGDLYLMGDERGMQHKKQTMTAAALKRGGSPLVATRRSSRDISDKERIYSGKCSARRSPDAAERDFLAEQPQLRTKRLLTH